MPATNPDSRNDSKETSNIFQREKLILAAAIIILNFNAANAAAPAAGVNSKLFNLLCKAITAKIPEKPQDPNAQLKAEITHTALLTKLVIADSTALNQLKKTGDTDPTPKKLTPKLEEICGTDKRAACQTAAQWVEDDNRKELKRLIQSLGTAGGNRQHIYEAEDELLSKATAKPAIDPEGAYISLQAKLASAQLGGKPDGATFRIEGAASNRETTCGTTGGKPTPGVQKSVAATLVCVCASDGTNQNNKGCTAGAGTQLTFTSEEAGQGTEYARLKAICDKSLSAKNEATAHYLSTIIDDITAELETGHGNDNKRGYLGWTESSSGVSDCDGSNTGGKGACAYFGETSGAVNKPSWLKDLNDAQAAAKNLEIAKTSWDHDEKELRKLNRTVIDLVRQQIINSIATTNSDGKPPSGNEKKLTEANCNAKDKETDCTSPCKWNNKAVDPKKKCTYNASKATAKHVPATQPQTGGTEATTGNCKGKLEPECTKAQECKWENNSCKDSSFTVDNKLAPIVYGFTSCGILSILAEIYKIFYNLICFTF
uniref:Variant surface glycoprotein 1125.523 n=1 Tax=Trypanosoma brucei TaxID=5691 RepID=A0A1J0R4D5_9TRYP|nr:variant surface glycoprotein 1125.523 [Trypanosoma brucei]